MISPESIDLVCKDSIQRIYWFILITQPREVSVRFKIPVIIVALTLLVTFVPHCSFAGGDGGDLGIGLSVTESSPTIMGMIWLSKFVTAEPTFSYSRIGLPRSRYAIRFSPGLGLLYHYKDGKEFRPFIGFRLAVDFLSVSDSSYSDLILDPVAGAEYFFSDNFSVCGEFQFKITKTDKTLSPALLQPDATYMNTAQLLRLNFYIK